MKLTLDNFQETIDQVILERGEDYYDRERVTNMILLEDNTYEFTVEGSEPYTVEIQLLGRQVISYSCDCPYDLGPVCKHTVASIFKLSIEGNILTKKKKKKKLSLKEELRLLLKKVSREELEDFLFEQSMQDKGFRNIFLASFRHLNEADNKGNYQKQIKGIFRSYAGRHKYIDWSQVPRLAKELSQFVQLVDKTLQQGNLQKATWMLTAVYEGIIDTLGHTDDSRGSLGDLIYYCSDLFNQLLEKDLKESLRKELFLYFCQAFRSKTFEGWDWHWDNLDYAQRLCKEASEAEEILKLVKNAQTDSKWDKERLEKIYFNLLLKTKGEDEAMAYLKSHLRNTDFRKKIIEQAIHQKNYAEGIRYAEEGMEEDQKDRPGLVRIWKDYLLQIAQLEGETALVIDYARQLFIKNSNPIRDYYALLKDTVPAKSWSAFVEDLLEQMGQLNRYGMSNLMTDIFIAEGYWDRLLRSLQQDPSFYRIQEFEPYLKKDYTKELAELYELAILEHLASNVNRKAYRKACKYIKYIKSLGAIGRATALVEELRMLYPQRRALLEELDKLS